MLALTTRAWCYLNGFPSAKPAAVAHHYLCVYTLENVCADVCVFFHIFKILYFVTCVGAYKSENNFEEYILCFHYVYITNVKVCVCIYLFVCNCHDLLIVARMQCLYCLWLFGFKVCFNSDMRITMSSCSTSVCFRNYFLLFDS